MRRRLTRNNCGGRDTSMQTHRTNSWRAILIQPSARLRPMSLALHTKASYASRAEAVTPVRRRTARTAGGQSSHSHPPGRDRSRSRPAPMPLTHSMRRTLFPSLPSSPPIPGSPPFPRDVASTLLFRRFFRLPSSMRAALLRLPPLIRAALITAAFVAAGCTLRLPPSRPVASHRSRNEDRRQDPERKECRT